MNSVYKQNVMGLVQRAVDAATCIGYATSGVEKTNHIGDRNLALKELSDYLDTIGTNPEVVDDVLDEVMRAIRKFPTWPSDPLHAAAVVNEEVGEWNKACLQEVYETHKNNPGDTYKEALQACAMLMRWLASYDRYVWRHAIQHDQPGLERSGRAHAAEESFGNVTHGG